MTVLVSDSFNRADSTTGLGTTDSYNGGIAAIWTNIIGTLGISSNQAYVVGTTGDSFSVVDVSQSDVSISITIPADTNRIAGIYLRVSDLNNWIRVIRVTNAIYVQKKVSGSVSTLLNKPTTLGNSDVLNVQANGSTINVYNNATSIGSVTDTFNQTATKHGIGVQGATNIASVRFDNFEIDSLGTGGTNSSITSVIANANASSLAPNISTSLSVSSIVTSSTGNALNPTVSTSKNNTITSVVANATVSAINSSTSITRNISLGSPISNAVASALVPNVGLSQSATISAVIASLVVDGIAPSITNSQGTNINAVVAGANADAISPTIKTDSIIYSITANSQASALSPNINGKLLVSKIYLNANRSLSNTLNANRSLTINLKVNQSKQVNLKGAIT